MAKLTGLLFLAVMISGCATGSNGRTSLFSVTAPVLAVLHDDLFVGEAVGYLDRTGSIDIRSALDPSVKCVGGFRYTGSRIGVADVRCNDGAEGRFSFNSLSALSGYGYGRTTRGPASFTFGLAPEEAANYLTLPKGMRLIRKPEGPTLEPI